MQYELQIKDQSFKKVYGCSYNSSIKISFKFFLQYLFVYMFVRKPVMVYTWRSEDNFQQVVLPFHRAGLDIKLRLSGSVTSPLLTDSFHQAKTYYICEKFLFPLHFSLIC